jgi:hypothetical protein
MSKYDKIDRSKLNERGKSVYDRLKKDTNDFKSVAGKRKEVLDKILDKQESLKSKSAPKKSKKKSSKKKKSKAPINKGTNRGSFAKLRAAIAKRDGISYKAALPKAKKEYAAQKKEISEKKRSKYTGRMEAFRRKYKGRGLQDVKEKGKLRALDVEKDSKIPAKAVGKRISEGKGKNQYGKSTKGNVYYEYRDNRTDQRQPQPTNIPRLNEGGDIVKDFDVNEPLGTYAKGGSVKDFEKGKWLQGKQWYISKGFGWVLERYKGDELIEQYQINVVEGDDYDFIEYSPDKGAEILIPENVQIKVIRLLEKVNSKYDFGDEYENQIRQNPYSTMYAKGGKTDDDFIQEAVKEMEKEGTVGAFSAKAKKAGMTTVNYAKKVLTKPEDFSEKTRKQAQFMKNINPELFNFGGEITRNYDVKSPLGTYAAGGEITEAGDVDYPNELLNYAKGGRTTQGFLKKAKGKKIKELKFEKNYNNDNDSIVRIILEDDSQFAFYSDTKMFGMYIPFNQLGETLSPIKSKGFAKGGELLDADTDVEYAKGGKVMYKIVDIDEEDDPYIVDEAGLKEYLSDWNEQMQVKYKNYKDFNKGEEYYYIEKFARGGRQGYDDKLDESLGNRRGKRSKKRQDYKDRRDESKGMERARYRRAYSSVGTMDKRERYL